MTDKLKIYMYSGNCYFCWAWCLFEQKNSKLVSLNRDASQSCIENCNWVTNKQTDEWTKGETNKWDKRFCMVSFAEDRLLWGPWDVLFSCIEQQKLFEGTVSNIWTCCYRSYACVCFSIFFSPGTQCSRSQVQEHCSRWHWAFSTSYMYM